MARKEGLNRKEQIQVKKWLENEEATPKQIAKKLRTTPEVILRFTPEKQAKAAEAVKEAEEAAKAADAARVEKAKTINAALNEDDFS